MRKPAASARGVRKSFLFALPMAVAAAMISSPASAALVLVAGCGTTDVSPTATACAGWYEGNLLNASGTHIQDQTDALATLGFTWDGNWAAVDLTKVDATGPDENIFDFAGTLNGDTWIGIYKGNGGQNGFAGTAFFRFDALSNLDSVSLNLRGASSAVVYNPSPAVPEPSTWAMLMFGFGGIGFAMRRRKGAGQTQRVRVTYS